MRQVPRALLAGGLGLAVSWLVACGGGSGLLSSDQASSLNSQLDQVSSAVSSGDCTGATNAISTFSNSIPGAINPTLRANLTQDATRVGQLAARDCHNATKATTPTAPNKTTATNPTASTPSTSTSTSTSTPSPTPPPSTAPATTPATPGTTSTDGSGGAGIGGGGTSGGGSGGGGSGGGAPGGGGSGN